MASGTPRIISRQILVAVEVGDLDHLRGLETEQVNAPFDVLDEHGYAPYNRSYRNVLDYAIRKFGGSATPAVVAVLLDKGAAIPAGLLTTVAGEASYRHAKDASLADESLDILRLLIEHGADVNYRDEEGMTALHAAASYHTPAFAAALLSAGADANAYRTIVQQAVRDEFSDFEDEEDEMNPPTPLMAAAKASVSCELVRLLLSRGADFERRDRAGRTASDFAREAVVGERYDRHVFSEPLDPDDWYYIAEGQARLAGEGERTLALLRDVRRAGSWKRYSNVPRLALLVLQKLCWRRRAAAPPGLLARLFPQEPQGRRRKRRTVEAPAIEELEATSGCKVTRPRTRKDAHDAAPLVLPDELFWKCLSFWKSSRDP